MKKILFIILFGAFFNGYTQVYDSMATKSVKLELANFWDDYPAFMLSFEHKLKGSVYLHHEAGVVVRQQDRFDRDISGFKLREEIRYYIDESDVTDFYLAFDIRYTQENVKDNIILGYKCGETDGSCQYYRNENGTFKKELLAFDIRAGIRHNFFPFFIEYDLGYGSGKDYISTPNIHVPPDYEIRNSQPFSFWETDWKIRLSVRGKIGFYFRKKNN